MDAIINTGKITDIRKVLTAEDLWAYQPPWDRKFAHYNPTELDAVCKRATKLLGVPGTDEWVCLVSVLWAAQIFRRCAHNHPVGILEIRRGVRAARQQPKGADARREFTKQTRKLAKQIGFLTSYLCRDKDALETARENWVFDLKRRSPAWRLAHVNWKSLGY